MAISGNRRSPLGKQARQVGDFADSLTRKVEVIYGEVPRGALNEIHSAQCRCPIHIDWHSPDCTFVPAVRRYRPNLLWPLTNLSKKYTCSIGSFLRSEPVLTSSVKRTAAPPSTCAFQISSNGSVRNRSTVR